MASTKKKAVEISDDEFDRKYDPIDPPSGESFWEAHEIRGQKKNHIWTVLDVDGVLYAVPGIHRVNRFGFLVTRKPWRNTNIEVRYASRIQQQPLMTMPDYGVGEEAEMKDTTTLQERWERGFQGTKTAANDTDSGAGSDEDKFYQDPEKREVLEFARSQAISNIRDVAVDHAAELDVPLKQELQDVAAAPPTPTQIVEEPGGNAVSTLNRYVIKTDDPAVEPAAKMNQDRMAFWKAEIQEKTANSLRHLLKELANLEELDENLNGVIDVFDASMKQASIDPEVTSQFQVLDKARKGLKRVKAVQEQIHEILRLFP